MSQTPMDVIHNKIKYGEPLTHRESTLLWEEKERFVKELDTCNQVLQDSLNSTTLGQRLEMTFADNQKLIKEIRELEARLNFAEMEIDNLRDENAYLEGNRYWNLQE